MKTLLVKSFLPVAAFMLASAGAVSTSNSTTSSTDSAAQQGFRRIAPFNCQPVKMCNNVSDVVCKDGGGQQLFGKSSPASDCTLILTHQQ
jgi:hypothetical protein